MLIRLLILAAFLARYAWSIQCGVPISPDIGVGSWTVENEEIANGAAWDELDEDTACTGADDGATSDWDSGNNPNITSELELTLTSLTDPTVDTGHVLRFSADKSASGGRTIDCIMELRQGGSQIDATCDERQVNIPDTYTDFAFTLPASCTSNITNYGDLDCVIDCEDTSGGPGRPWGP